jgi:hypothetical protein
VLFTSKAKLADQLVTLLAEHPACTSSDLLERLGNGTRSYGRRALYKELHELQDQAVVIRSSGRYSLRLGWVAELEKLTETAHHRNIESIGTALPLSEGDSQTIWRFNGLRRVDDYWIQVALSLFDQTTATSMFYWIRHSWFSLAHPAKDDQFQRAMRRRGRRLYMAIGGQTFLDHLPSQTWPTDVYRVSFDPSPFDHSKLGSITAIGDYVVTVRLDARLSRAVEALYARVQRQSDLTVEAHRELFTTKGRCTLLLERSPSKAALYLGRFQRFFQLE